ncbi:MAG: hypothetical protein NC084_07140 [Bacteroides sp.]|nr:hypothetical protein [Eubacterium sp.]MCM1418372.1 hypothetical protein [Roseburia sp.]MCM1462473.1 hypothetical protein [Bacteroides sp.]
MISNFIYQKNVDSLHERMQRVNRAYRLAFRFVFYTCLIFFAIQIFYNALLLFTMSLAWMREIQDQPTNINWRFFFPDPLIYGVPPLGVILGYCAFYRKMRVVKVIFFLLDIAYLIACIVMLALGYDETSYVCAILVSIASLTVTIDCFRADKEDLLLSKIPGYPWFDPMLMEDVLPDLEAREALRFREKSADELIGERDREYLEQNPKSESAIAEQKRREEERDQAIADWLDEMLEPTKEKTE